MRTLSITTLLLLPALAQAHPGHGLHAEEVGLIIGILVATGVAATRIIRRRVTAAARRPRT